MPELRSIVDRALEQVPVRPLTLETLHRCRDRKRRNQRIRAGVAGLTIGLLLLLMGSRIIRSSSTAPIPASVPTQVPARHTGMFTIATDSGVVLLGHGSTPSQTLVSGTVSSFAWSPDGSELAYLMTPTGPGSDVCSLWVLDMGTDQARRLTPCHETRHPLGQLIDWAPDGTRIAYESGDQIHVIATDGTGDRVLVTGVSPSWSPDGGRLAFIDADDRVSVYATATGVATPVGAVQRPGQVAWSPDNGKIAVLDDVPDPSPAANGDPGELQVWIMRPDGSHGTRLAVQHGCCLGAIPTMGFSPDGSKILLTGVQFQIIDVSTGASRIGHRPIAMVNGVAPAWRPVP